MSVIVKGMDMPESCGKCFVGNREICVNGCPLIPVPQHGRLIDADELLSSLAHNLGIRSLEYLTSQERAIVSWIDAAPTIIPAEESE